MGKDLDIRMADALKAYLASGVEEQVDCQKFYLYSIVTHSTAIEGSTVTEIENQLLFDEGIAAKGRSLTEQMMNVDLKDAYLHAFKVASENPIYTPQLLQQLSARVMRRTGSEYSTIAGQFDSFKGEFRLCNVSAGIGGRSYLDYNKVPRAVDDFCKWLNKEIANLNRRVLQYGEEEGLNEKVGVNVGIDSQNVGVKLTSTQKNVYDLIQKNQNITHSEMAKALSVTTKTAERATKALRELELIRREGSDKTGKWVILK